MKRRTWWIAGAALVLSAGLITAFALRPGIPSTRAAELDRRVEEWTKAIAALDPAPTLSSRFPSPDAFPEEFQAIYEFGFASAPYLLDRVENAAENGWNEALLFCAAVNNLHLEEWMEYENHTNMEDRSPKGYTRRLKAFLKTVPKEVRAICSSDDSLAEKYEKLNYYGMAAVPFLADRIDKDETEWEAFIAAQTLGMPAADRFVLRLQNDLSSYASKAARAPDNTDVRSWLRDNAEDLEILRDYIR